MILLIIFYFLASVSIWLGLLSLRSGVRFVRYVQSETARNYPPFTPFVTVIVPLRGLDDGLYENITAIFSQDYPAYEVIFVSDDENDIAWAIIEKARLDFKDTSGPTMRTVIAGPAVDRGQKVHNLSVAANDVDRASEVLVFVDSDARPASHWLSSLVAPLEDETVGATTGYRWFVPIRGGLSSHLRSVWNAAIASALGSDEQRNFCWGGSTAIRRKTFESCEVIEHWRGTVSDDFAMTRALRASQRTIKFVPQCLTPSFEECSFHELIEFTTRQMKLTRAYAPHLWKPVLLSSAWFVLVFFGGIGFVLARALMGLSFALPLALLMIIFAMGAMKSHLRLRAVTTIIKDKRARSWGSTIAHMTMWPLASALYLYNTLAAAISRRITWRGIGYELKSAGETVIVSRKAT
ncbi:MAG TPA: glycosyltransferase family 2 protein [Pyrinomonadaceae bacterium]|nr:glycosyltransferase family 2 protein [Pyrinomonadaceae bacterium]